MRMQILAGWMSVLMLFACKAGTQKNEMSVGTSIGWEETDMVAVAFAGYFKDSEALKASPEYAKYVEKYQVADVPVVETEGDEWYLFIPRDPNASVTVNVYTFEMFEKGLDPASGEILYKSEGNPFWLKCNLSDALGNTNVTIAGSDGKVLKYTPSIDLRDGTLSYPGVVASDSGSILDITEQKETEGLAQEINRRSDNFSVYVLDGKVMLTIYNAVGALSDGEYVVKGLEGNCKGLFVGNIGQDINPIICMLMDDGGVEILEYGSVAGRSDVEPGHLYSSGRLPGMKDIVSFRDGVVEDVFEGEVVGGYVTIFAIDSKGQEYEIERCVRPLETLVYQVPSTNGTEEYVLTVWPDWKIQYKRGWEESELLDEFFGRIRPLKMDYENNIFEYTYEMLEHCVYDTDLESGMKVEKSSEKGSFRLVGKTQDGVEGYDFTSLSGDLILDSDPSKTLFLKPKYRPGETAWE